MLRPTNASFPHSFPIAILVYSHRMSAKEQCDEIIKKFNGTTLAGADQPLVCKFAEAASNKRRFHTTPMDHRRLSGDAELLNEHQRIGDTR